MNQQNETNGNDTMRISSLALVGLILTAFLAMPLAAQVPAQSAAAVEASASGFELRDGVVVDPNSERIYAMSRDGGVEALSLEGAVVWRSEVADRPLGLYGELLIAQPSESTAGRMDLVFLDETGAGVGSAAVDLAPGVVARVAEVPQARFDARARVVDGVPVFDWQYTSFRRGALLAPDPGTPGQPAAAPGLPLQAALQNANPQVVGGAFAYDPQDGSQTSVSDAPRAAPAVSTERLVPTAFVPNALEAMHSKDGRHILAVERVAPGTSAEYRWTVFDAQSGARIGSTTSRLGGANFFVSGNTIVYEASPFIENGQASGLRLVAKNLADGTLSWEREIFDTAYRGPMPP